MARILANRVCEESVFRNQITHHEDAKSTKFGNLIFRNLRVLRAFVVNENFSIASKLDYRPVVLAGGRRWCVACS